MYTIGKIQLTQQAFAVFLVGSLISVLNMYSLRRAGWKIATGSSMIMFAGACYATYLTNCTVVGSCKELAWFLVILNVLTALAFIKVRVL
jgi:hypothetical protein